MLFEGSCNGPCERQAGQFFKAHAVGGKRFRHESGTEMSRDRRGLVQLIARAIPGNRVETQEVPPKLCEASSDDGGIQTSRQHKQRAVHSRGALRYALHDAVPQVCGFILDIGNLCRMRRVVSRCPEAPLADVVRRHAQLLATLQLFDFGEAGGVMPHVAFDQMPYYSGIIDRQATAVKGSQQSGLRCQNNACSAPCVQTGKRSEGRSQDMDPAAIEQESEKASPELFDETMAGTWIGGAVGLPFRQACWR